MWSRVRRSAIVAVAAVVLVLPGCQREPPLSRVDRPPFRPWIEGAPGHRVVGAKVTAESGFAPLADELKPAVVNLFSDLPLGPGQERPAEGPDDEAPPAPGPAGAGVRHALGSGAIISPEGHILTNRHVVAGAESIRARLLDGREFAATLVGSDDRFDLALVKVDAATPLPTVTMGDSDTLRVGQWLLVVGNPFGLQHSVTVGILSARDRRIGNGPFDDFLQTDAAINPGNSGGPIFDVDGRMVAVARSTRRGAQGIGFAVPVNAAKEFVEEILSGERVVAGWLGVSTQDPEADAAGSPAPGVRVVHVEPGSPAATAGLQPGDLIRAVAGRPVGSRAEFRRVMGMTRVGEAVELVLSRGGRDGALTVTVQERPAKPPADAAGSPAAPPPTPPVDTPPGG